MKLAISVRRAAWAAVSTGLVWSAVAAIGFAESVKSPDSASAKELVAEALRRSRRQFGSATGSLERRDRRPSGIPARQVAKWAD